VARDFFLLQKSVLVMGPIRPSIQQLRGVNRPELEVTHIPLSSAEIKNDWSCTSSPLYAFMT